MFVFFTIILLVTALYAVLDGHITNKILSVIIKRFLGDCKKAKEDMDKGCRIDADDLQAGLAVVGIAMFGAVAVAVIKLIYLAFAFSHDPYTYPTLFLIALMLGHTAWSTLRNKKKSTVSVTKEPADKELSNTIKQMEEVDKTLIRRTFWSTVKDILYLVYYAYMLYVTVAK